MREHGTHACYVFGPEPGGDTSKGCRCDECRRAAREYERERTRRTAPPYVGAARARAHIAFLSEHGIGLKTLAKRSGVSHGALWKIVYGVPSVGRGPSKRVRHETEQAILAVQPSDAADGARIPGAATHQHIKTLLERGWTKAAIGKALLGEQATSLQLPCATDPEATVRAGHARRIKALLDEPVPERRTRWGTVRVEPEADEDEGQVFVPVAFPDPPPTLDPAIFDAPWRRRAACRLVPDDERWIFWPARGDHRAVAAAKKVCASCPVSGECLAYALDVGETGIWGGTSEKERRSLRRVRGAA